jgi:hypothetical protein
MITDRNDPDQHFMYNAYKKKVLCDICQESSKHWYEIRMSYYTEYRCCACFKKWEENIEGNIDEDFYIAFGGDEE